MIGISRNSSSVFCMKWRKNVSRCHSVENDIITNNLYKETKICQLHSILPILKQRRWNKSTHEFADLYSAWGSSWVEMGFTTTSMSKPSHRKYPEKDVLQLLSLLSFAAWCRTVRAHPGDLGILVWKFLFWIETCLVPLVAEENLISCFQDWTGK